MTTKERMLGRIETMQLAVGGADEVESGDDFELCCGHSHWLRRLS